MRRPAGPAVEFGWSEIEPGAAPEVGVTVSHDGWPETVHAKLPVPEFVIDTVVAAGSAPEICADHVAVVGETERRGPAATLSVTPTVFGDPASEGAATVSVPRFGPTGTPLPFAAIETVASPIPEGGVATSHGWLDVTVHAADADPPVVIEMFCAGGWGDAAVAANVSVAGDTASGGPAVTSSVTVTRRGESSAAGSVIVIVPV